MRYSRLLFHKPQHPKPSKRPEKKKKKKKKTPKALTLKPHVLRTLPENLAYSGLAAGWLLILLESIPTYVQI